MGLLGGIVTFVVMLYSSAVYNTFDLLPRWTSPIYYICFKLLLMITGILVTSFGAELASQSKSRREHSGQNSSDTNNNTSHSLGGKSRLDLGYNLFIAFGRLGPSIYLVNYWFIRYDFLTSRIPFDITALSFVRNVVFFHGL